MKHIHIILDDDDVEKLLPYKGDLTWRELLMSIVEGVDDI